MNLKQIGSNLTEATTKGERILFSYETPVAYQSLKTGIYFKTTKKWSKTTSKHINAWLNGAEANELPQIEFDDLVKGE